MLHFFQKKKLYFAFPFRFQHPQLSREMVYVRPRQIQRLPSTGKISKILQFYLRKHSTTNTHTHAQKSSDAAKQQRRDYRDQGGDVSVMEVKTYEAVGRRRLSYDPCTVIVCFSVCVCVCVCACVVCDVCCVCVVLCVLCVWFAHPLPSTDAVSR